MFIDVATIKIKAGNGGDGAVSFHREKYVAAGGPDGGDGGRGGDIIFKADDNLSTLSDFRYKRKYKAGNGQNGKGKRASGKNAEDLVIRVPRGTLVKEITTGKILADISDTQNYIIAKGGKGGFGNARFATSTRQTPRFANPGTPGQELEVQLELKLLADVGLIGYPNVGKSTLISVVSQAKPVIANYHFTTITPVLGVVNMGVDSSFVMADIPGLIEGAWEGLGLGHRFLRHIERCRVLVHVVDVSGSEGRDPIKDFETINNEIKKFNEDLASKPMIVVGSKCDLATEEKVKTFKEFVEELGFEFFDIISPTRYNVQKLLKKIEKVLQDAPPIKKYEPSSTEDLFSVDPYDDENYRKVYVTYKDGTYIVECERLKRKMNLINFEDHESLQYFQRLLSDYGVTSALNEKGISEGDVVNIYGMEFDFVE